METCMGSNPIGCISSYNKKLLIEHVLIFRAFLSRMHQATKMPRPWLCHLLETVKAASKSPPVAWIHDPYSVSDVDYVKECVRSCTFDTEGLQKKIYDGFKAGTVALEKKSCPYGSVLVMYEKSAPWAFPYAAVGRVLQLFYRGRPFRVLFFGSQALRLLPPPQMPSKPVSACHINGGYTYPCDPGTIVIYRREEVVRVLIHECYHASCSDPRDKAVEHLEADTEAWAEVALCALAARGREDLFRRFMKLQILYAYRQTAVLVTSYNVKVPEDYAWRYTIGKFDVWRRLGLMGPMPASALDGLVRPVSAGGSLRLTVEMPGMEDAVAKHERKS